jgi:hypothetical protein
MSNEASIHGMEHGFPIGFSHWFQVGFRWVTHGTPFGPHELGLSFGNQTLKNGTSFGNLGKTGWFYATVHSWRVFGNVYSNKKTVFINMFHFQGSGNLRLGVGWCFGLV